MTKESTMTEPIAIIGLSFRFPGGADNEDRLWEILANGEQAWTEVPKSRYNADAFYHPDCDARGTHNARGGFFLEQDVSVFDAKFFGIPDAEAAAIDPQQRMLLEVSYEALESAGLPIESLRGSQTGVYIALVSRDYDRHIYKDPSDIPKHHLTGCGDATACGRISYTFDFRGPAMTIDTGCSGGLVALNVACQSLQRRESDITLVGGANLLLGPDMTVAMSSLHMVNENGRCYPFDERGAGYGRAEGVAVLVLKRLSDAQRDGDHIRAVVLESGVGQDGKSNGILMPNSFAQQHLAQSLFDRTGIDPQSIAHVEMHGTGTVAGDSAEIKSIRGVFVGDGSRRQQSLTVGSIKANLGHSESTSGLAGVISAILSMERRCIPPVAALRTVKSEVTATIDDGKIHVGCHDTV
jgi:acyl transferase domain-containing protein